MKTVKIFWTGGWDSTFRIIQLSRKKIKIQPYYLRGRKKSTPLELRAMKKIKSEIMKLDSTKAEFLPTIIFTHSDIPEDKIITESYKRLKPKFGNQYEALSRFAKGKEYMEVSIEKDENNPTFEPFQTMTVIEGKNVLDKERANQDIYNLFGYFSFPIMDITKLEMRRATSEWGCEHLLEMTWFCHDPIDSEPCGTCRPCRLVMEGGLGDRLPLKARKRYFYRNFKDRIKKVLGG